MAQYEVKLPDIGEGVAEGEVVRWLVKTGDAVKEDQPLLEVMTDKANVEIPSPRTGTIAALLVEEGQVVPVGTVLLSIEVREEAAVAAPAGASAAPAPSSAPAAAPNTPAARNASAPASAADATGDPAPPTPAPATTSANAPVQAAPAVRQLAKELGVALDTVAGTGAGGRVTPDDVRRAASSPKVAVAAKLAADALSKVDAAAGVRAPAGGEER